MGSYVTVNYLFASYLQTGEGGGHRIKRVEVIKPGKAKFFFDLSEEQAAELKLKWVSSSCAEFENLRKSTIDLAFR